MIIKNGALTGVNGLAQGYINFETGQKTVEITLSDNYLQNATKLSIARTIIHEMVHGYIIHQLGSDDYEFIGNFHEKFGHYLNQENGENRAHHEYMTAYIDMKAFSLKKWDTQFGDGKGLLGDDYYRSMGFGGLMVTNTIPTDGFLSLVPNQA